MSFPRSLRGGCQCGRNRYIIQMPEGAGNVARVLFDSHPSHRKACPILLSIGYCEALEAFNPLTLFQAFRSHLRWPLF
jgi:hypothetical protein